MRAASARPEGRGFPLALLVASVLAVLFFVLVFGVTTFLLRDLPVYREARVVAPPPVEGPPAPEARPRPGFDERQSASTVIAPVLPGCFREAGARDPSLPEVVEVIATLETAPGRGSVVSLRLGGATSPFLVACLRQRLVGASFPAGADGYGEVRWRARIEQGSAVLEDVESPAGP